MRRQQRNRIFFCLTFFLVIYAVWPLLKYSFISYFGSDEARAYSRSLQSGMPLLSNQKLCLSRSIDLVVIIISSDSHFLERQAIRETWRSVNNIHHVTSKHLFVVGYHEDGGFYGDILNEAQHHDDILYLTVDDDDATQKELQAYRWLSDNCGNVTYTFKTEDDLFVNTFLLHELIHELNTETYRYQNRHLYNSSLDNLFLAHINPDAHTFLFGWAFQPGKPERNKKMAPYYVSVDEYPKDQYPRYCSGFGYLFDAKTRDSIMSQSLQDEKPFRLSDIYVSGILPERLNFICDILPFTFHQGLAEECIDLIKKNNRKSSQGPVPPLIVCSTGRHIAQNSYSDYYRMWTVLKYVHNDLLTSTQNTNA